MDDPSHQSPPSSRKSSVLGKLDRPETPNRGSPYLTRSRRSSTLTEENVAVHNDTPIVKRVTRRMSQNNDSAAVVTPIVGSRRITRRSPSVASGDDITATPKKKFSVAQENVVIEEDETTEENKLEPTVAGTNGSKIEKGVDKENINTVINGSASAENLHRKSLDFNGSNQAASVVEEQPPEPKVATEAVTVDSNKQNTLPVEVSAVTTESLKPIVSTPLSSDPSSTSSSKQIPITNTQTVVAINEQVEPDSTKLSDSPVNILRKSITETSAPAGGILEVTNISPKLDSTSQSELNANQVEINTPTKSNALSVSEVIVIADTPNTSIKDDIIVIPETPVQTRQTSLQIKLSKIVGTPKAAETPKAGQTLKAADTPKVTETPKVVETPKATETLNVVETPKASKTLKAAETPKATETSKATETPKVVETPKAGKTLKAAETAKIVEISRTMTRQSIRQAESLKTPTQTKKSGKIDLTITPLSITTAVPDSQQTECKTSPKTPIQTKISHTSHTTQETPKSTLNYSNVTESEEEILLRTPPTPSKTATELMKPKVDVTTASAANNDGAPKLGVSPLTTAQLQNGTQDTNDENPKWANSIRRKSDGQPIDKFGVNKANAEVTTSEANPSKNELSTVIVGDTSDEESCIDADSSENEQRNMFLDDEAMESNGEASMDEEERKYLEENEIPEDGISLGSESDEAVSEEEESDDSFVVSDSSVQLLDGSGDDLGIGNESTDRNLSKSKVKRGNKILDTSDEELESKEESKKISKKRRPDTSLNRTAKYLRVDAEEEDDNANEGGDEDELANLDVEPKKTKSSKRFSESTSLSKSDTKRLSLHPNMKLSSLKSKDEQYPQSIRNKNDKSRIDDDSEEDVTQELANLDEEPKKINRSKTLESMDSPKKDVKRHPNTKPSNVKSTPNKQTTDENSPPTVDKNSKADVEEELANLDVVPKRSKNNKRLSELNSLSKKETKRLSLHPNTKFSSLGSNGGVQEQNQQPTVNESDLTGVADTREQDVEEELANLDDEPKQMGKSKRLSAVTSLSKKDTKRFSLHPDTKLNRSGLGVKVDASTVATADSNDVENIDIDQSAPSTSQPKKEIDVKEIQAKCDEVLQMANEAKRLEKLNKKPMQEDKYQKLKEKKAAKLQEKKAKEARELEREAQAAKQRQLKRDKKLRIAEVIEAEKSQAIEKALKFSEILKARKTKHSSEATEVPLNESSEVEPTTSKRKRKPKTLQILNQGSNPTKKKRVDDTVQLPARPEGFKINSLPLKQNKVRPMRIIQQTSAGNFEIEPVPKKSASPFVVTTLQYNPAIRFSTFRDRAIASSNVQRVSSAQILGRRKKTRNTPRI